MVAEDFIIAKRGLWERLAELTRAAQNNIVSLRPNELQELGQLYRQATSDLAQARRDYPGHLVNVYLNDLVATGHTAIYRNRRNSLQDLRYYFMELLPRTFRESLPFMLAALGIFVFAFLVGWIVTIHNLQNGISLMPELASTVADIQTKREWWKTLNDDNAGGAAFILTNNIYISLQALVGGMSFGIVTLYTLYHNGLMLGIVSGASHVQNFSTNLWGFVTAHAVVELSIIVLAGGAGLQIAWALLRPGQRSRRESIMAAGRKSFILSGAIVLFLIMAGLIEGFISPSNLPYPIKLAVAIGSGIILYGYLFLVGRQPREDIVAAVAASSAQKDTN